MSNRLENPPACAPVQGLLVFEADHEHKEIRREQQKSSAKLRRRHTDHRVRPLVHIYPAAQQPSITLKMPVPISITKHDIKTLPAPCSSEEWKNRPRCN